MKVKIKRVDSSLPLPEYKTEGSVGFDFYSRKDVTVKPGEHAYVPLNAIIATPEGYMLAIIPRSSTFKRTGLIVPNSFGVMDCDYCGDDDEIFLQVFNVTKKTAKIERGQRIAQGIFYPIAKVIKWNEVKKMNTRSRGGFGSTGK